MTYRKTSFADRVCGGTLLTLIALLGAGNLRAEDRPEIRLCASMPMTGNISFYGKGFRDSAELALSELRDTKYRYSLLVEDDQASAARAVSAFQKLVSIDHCSVVFSATANIALALAPVARQRDVLHLGISSDPAFADAEQNFNIWPAPEIPAQKLVAEFKRRGLKRVALLGLQHAWPRAVFKELAQRIADAGLLVTMHDYFSPGELNFRPLLERLRVSNSDIAVILSWSPELEVLGKQYHELHIPVPLTCEFSFESSTEPALFDNFWFINMASTPDVYRDRFKARFGYRPYAQMELGDVMVRLMVDAFEQAGDGKSIPSRASLAKQLLEVRSKPSLFGTISIRADGVLDAPYVLKVVKEGKFETVEDSH